CTRENPCDGLGDHANFKHFGMAFFTLFRIATGDNWNAIMKDTMRDNCDKDPQCVRNCCPIPYIGQVYFVVFVLMAQFVLVNVVVAVLMKHLEESHKTLCDDEELDREVQQEIEEEQLAKARLLVVGEAIAVTEESSRVYENPPVNASSLDPENSVQADVHFSEKK
ncbi:hypothetical protein Ciccas_005840, partial [Cichlidogyrus casuarinus]